MDELWFLGYELCKWLKIAAVSNIESFFPNNDSIMFFVEISSKSWQSLASLYCQR